ncbi:putative transcription factor GRAS family [Helianthus annuus]|uniref:Putative transcription factor GRAS n=1 Tax=Helianthus annuus TaxID=4232 RepID=A0A251VGG2_HELAN|nr:DELLA protein GAI [Helianthus annuus]KAF5819165.1 putative transcription factor GRAS family [Helianthus annuus]KAJ0605363.1 putative transcription factor GRAS family [Helianthus annuus]KAJ0619380.1 putative transcription factor GRAS family [Helianthus annuus]KAJ0940671.1 putative transcription factor GRAS family [Helianthus annuus]
MEKLNDISSYSKGDAANQEIEKLPPLLFQEDDLSDRFSSSKEYDHQLDALFLDATPPLWSYEHKMQELEDIESQYFKLIKPRARSQDHVAGSEVSDQSKLSTDDIIRLGGEHFIQSRSVVDNSISTHPYSGSLVGLSDQELKDVQLIENLLLSSEKVAQQQFDRSRKLLDLCDALSSSSGNPIQRIVYYFSQALREKINKETGRISSFTGSGKKNYHDMQGRIMNTAMTRLSIYQKLPFYQAANFSCVQALVDRVSKAKRVHVVELAIRQGVHTMILMQALASQPEPIKHLKITAVGTGFEKQIKQTGGHLKSFAESINLSFSYNMVIVEDILDFNIDLLELNPREALGVFSMYGLWSMIGQQDRLESLMKVIKSIKPRVMVMCEVAANLNSPNFVNRLIEALFHYGAVFDSLEDCMDGEDEHRGITESMYLGEGIRSIVAAEGAERAVRHVNIDVWRKFFARFGMKEIGFSVSSLYQAKLVAGKFPCGSCCTFDKDGKSVNIGWKGTPIECLSAWKFS